MRVVIADDSALLREGLARLLSETGVEVTATVADATALEEVLATAEVEVAIVDIRMPPTYTHEGAEAAVRLREAHPTLGILLLSQAIETQHAAELLERDASHFGYLLKDRVVDVADAPPGAGHDRRRRHRPRPRDRAQHDARRTTGANPCMRCPSASERCSR